MFSSEVLPPQYLTNSWRKDRTSSGDGVILAIKDGYVANEVQTHSAAEEVWAKVELPKGSMHIGSFYRPPNSGIQPLDHLDDSISTLSAKGKHVIVGGDFNCGDVDWETGKVNSGAYDPPPNNRLIDLANDHSLTQVQRLPTRRGRALDILFTNNPTLVKSSSVVPVMSDHDGMVVVDVDIRPVFHKSKPRLVHCFRRAQWELIKAKSKAFSEKFISESPRRTVNENWLIFRNHVEEMMEKHVPSKKLTTRYNLPWFNKKLKTLVRRKHKLYNKVKQSKCTESWALYRHVQKQTNKVLKQSQRQYMSDHLADALSENSTKPF